MLHVATVATHSERYLPVLEKMTQDKGHSLNKLGFGKKYKGHFMKDLEMIEFLKDKKEDDIVVFLDGFDTLMLSSEEEIIKKFKESGKKMLVSVENIRNSFLTHSYQFQKVQGKFINTGLYMGYCGFVLKFLETMYSKNYNKKSNQTTWSYFLNSKDNIFNGADFGVDSESKLFLNHSFTCNNVFRFNKKDKRIELNTKIQPCFIQGNGVVNMNDLIKNLGYKKENIFGKNLFIEQIKYSYNAVMNTYPVLRFFISSIVLVCVMLLVLSYSGYKLRKNSNVNFIFS